MDKHDIRRKALAAREVTEEVAPGVHINLRLPTRQEVAVAAAKAGVHNAGNETAGLVIMQRDLILAAVVGWGQGVRLNHLLPEESAEVLPFDADLVPLLLDAQPAWESKLQQRFVAERLKRNAMLEAAEKNSASASPGSLNGVMRLPTMTEIPASASSTGPAAQRLV